MVERQIRDAIVRRVKEVNFKEELLALQDISYADFQAKLTPNIPRDLFIGVRVPELRKLAKKVAGDLFRMYSMYADKRGYKTEVMSTNETGIGGF